MSKILFTRAIDGDHIMKIPMEFRRLPSSAISARKEGEGDDATIFGYALKWDDTYDIFGDGSFVESFRRGSFEDTLKNSAHEQALLVEHGGPALASTQNNTISLKEDKVGLAFEAKLDMRMTDGKDAYYRTESGTSTGVSVGFSTGKREIEETEDGNYRIEHTSVGRLWEFSLVHFPAYTSSDVDTKSYRSFLLDTEERVAEELRLAEAERLNRALLEATIATFPARKGA